MMKINLNFFFKNLFLPQKLYSLHSTVFESFNTLCNIYQQPANIKQHIFVWTHKIKYLLSLTWGPINGCCFATNFSNQDIATLICDCQHKKAAKFLTLQQNVEYQVFGDVFRTLKKNLRTVL